MSLHVVQPRTYVTVFLCLLALTALTVAAAFVDLSTYTGVLLMNDIVMLGIAVIKAVLVITIFMHVKYSGRLTALTVLSGVVFFLILVGITLSDYFTRGIIPGK